MPNLGIVVSEFHADVTERMLVRAEEHAAFQGLTVTHVVKVPGVFDMPSPSSVSSGGTTSTESLRWGPSFRGRPATMR